METKEVTESSVHGCFRSAELRQCGLQRSTNRLRPHLDETGRGAFSDPITGAISILLCSLCKPCKIPFRLPSSLARSLLFPFGTDLRFPPHLPAKSKGIFFIIFFCAIHHLVAFSKTGDACLFLGFRRLLDVPLIVFAQFGCGGSRW